VTGHVILIGRDPVLKKRVEFIKTIQLILFVVLIVLGLYTVFSDRELYQLIGNNASVRTMHILLWALAVLSLLFILWDFASFSSLKKDYSELDFAVHNDHIAGIANRFSCDAMIEKYLDKPLPDTVGCIMVDLTNIRQINDAKGYVAGNAAIHAFSNILHTASLGLCFVGRNGGNKFMALFEECSSEKMDQFHSRVLDMVQHYNTEPENMPLQYQWGNAFREGEQVKTINQLIALADRRLREKAQQGQY
jgi:diguanylate cyclase (GGDEF)-like protein